MRTPITIETRRLSAHRQVRLVRASLLAVGPKQDRQSGEFIGYNGRR